MKVYVEGFDAQYEEMFQRRGHRVVEKVEDADVVQFVGGADVNPALYGEEPHPATSFSDITDQRSINLYENAITHGLPMLGICRGGQFLNVMNGGKLYQDVDNHAIYGTHKAYDVRLKTMKDVPIEVTSTHHQMMRPSEEGLVVCIAGEANRLEWLSRDGGRHYKAARDEDVEVVWYEHTRSLCFQPHPEIVDKDHECQHYYFELIERYLGL